MSTTPDTRGAAQSVADLPEHLLAMWQADITALSQVKMHGPMVELILPLSTLTSKFVSVFVKPHHEGGWWVHDNNYLETDAYYVGDEASTADHGHRLQEEYDVSCYLADGQAVFFKHITDPALLTSAVLDMAQFIQLSVNLAYLEAA
ncbi:hypothetical protein LJ737_20615 [Hymenobacter sp. 15J16-1T3B]|uniref:hypothetical protein n=1 Tax=Hymenobacter sp. 15J16-1T3B TaxID=2886941 RepID=UPI001D11E2E0|nr:hypothetical protein [Hymenobacter sp. 15J16-1T3B]MCC3159656.1 hypothetical protein [Hymenobacter sp. 15J16-1T3B]